MLFYRPVSVKTASVATPTAVALTLTVFGLGREPVELAGCPRVVGSHRIGIGKRSSHAAVTDDDRGARNWIAVLVSYHDTQRLGQRRTGPDLIVSPADGHRPAVRLTEMCAFSASTAA